jgi:hypothetical protein
LVGVVIGLRQDLYPGLTRPTAKTAQGLCRFLVLLFT